MSFPRSETSEAGISKRTKRHCDSPVGEEAIPTIKYQHKSGTKGFAFFVLYCLSLVSTTNEIRWLERTPTTRQQ